MSKTTAMRLVELMVYKEDIHAVLAYLGKLGEFQFQDDVAQSGDEKNGGEQANPDADVYRRLQTVRAELDIPDLKDYTEELSIPTEQDRETAEKIIATVEDIHARELEAGKNLSSVADAYTEAMAFSNLKMPYSELETLSFLTLRLGKIEDSKFDLLKAKLGNRAILVRVGNDSSRIMVACAKNARFFVDTELKNIGFQPLQVPENFKGIPEDAIERLAAEKQEKEQALETVQTERRNFVEAHRDSLMHLLQVFSVGSQIYAVENSLESTQFVYRISGWVPAYLTHDMSRAIDSLTNGRTGIREFLPSEVQAVVSGGEKVPVQLKHGKLVSNFERMIFSYGSPLYGTVDPTPFVAIFFTVLFGIMFGDAGQGLVFLILGILMTKRVIRLGGWEKFNLIFICIGISSTIMGLLTGEFFASATVLRPFERWVTGLFGTPRDQILPMMPSSDPASIKRMFLFFGFTVGVGFIINSTGIIINIVNQFSLKRKGVALFGKTGVAGAVFFWYVIVFALRVAFLHHSPALYDWIIMGVALFLTAFGEPFARMVDGERPLLENGLFAAIIAAVVEIIEVISSYLSNTVSFLRVGAFALAHAVLGFIIEMLAELAPGPAGILVLIVGNVIVVVLEGMIVAIQVVRLQYYEFFSKFFTESGREFKPFRFTYGTARIK